MFEVVELGGVKTVTSVSNLNHVYVVDCSGSMYSDLPKIRQHLKNIISLVPQPGDTFSVIWFSGRNQCGVVFENLPVDDAATLAVAHKAIDKYLVPSGLTSFVDPIDLALTLSLKPGNLNNFIFMSDGYDNQSSRTKILERTAELSTVYHNVAFIEYGYYADREMLTAMAESVNGIHMFAEGMVNYEQVVESAIKSTARVSTVDVNVNKRAKHAIYQYNGQIRIVSVEDGVAKVPEDVARVHSIVPTDVLNKQLSVEHLLMILFYAAKTNNVKLTWDALQAIGDEDLVESYQNAFTKQEQSVFLDHVEAAIKGEAPMFVNGRNTEAVPAKGAKTIVGLLNTLSMVGASLVLDSPHWGYNRTTKASTAGDTLPRFVKSPMQRSSLRGLVFNSSRPNVSIGMTQNGVVELPENEFGLKSVPSHIHRNYTIIRDGIKNVKELPVVLPTQVYLELETVYPAFVVEQNDKETYAVFNLNRIPVINRKKVEEITLEKVVSTISQLEIHKAAQKVINALIKEQGGSDVKIAGLIDTYGEEAAKWLSSIGVRDYGFSPVNTKTVEATDAYMSIEFDYKIKGMSSLPSIEAVRKKLSENKKLTLGDNIIAGLLAIYGAADMEMLEASKTITVAAKRSLELELADMVYTIILGRVWWGDTDEYVTEITINGETAPLTLIKTRKEIKI
jgi:hypothetical protein